MSSNIDYVSNKLPLFTHKKDWVQWSELFLARARRKGYKQLLVGNVEIPIVQATPYTEEQQKIADLDE